MLITPILSTLQPRKKRLQGANHIRKATKSFYDEINIIHNHKRRTQPINQRPMTI